MIRPRSTKSKDIYDARFYDDQRNGSVVAARVVVPMLVGLFHPKSVIDIGCGVGGWLKTFDTHGVKDYQGVEGEWALSADTFIDKKHIVNWDLSNEYVPDRKYDLAICLEVAEHLQDRAGRHLVKALCAASDAVVFSAAIPGQGGDHHINEQWQEYWVGIFGNEGFECDDSLRGRIWNEDIPWWYPQNILIFRNVAIADSERTVGGIAPLNIVHPKNYKRLLELEHVGAVTLLRQLPRALWHGIHRRLVRR